jgi:hypothetical protein
VRITRLTPTNLRAAWWTVSSVRQARRALARDGLQARIPPPPPLPDGAYAGVLGSLRRTHATCLERATVIQAWWLAQGRPRDIVVGVSKDGGAFVAHAWLDVDGTTEGDGYREIRRIPAPVAADR